MDFRGLILICLSCLFLLSRPIANAAEIKKDSPVAPIPLTKVSDDGETINFGLPENGVELLPQVLEYELDREGNLKIGNTTISASEIDLQMNFNTIKFTWPKAIWNSGSIEVRSDDEVFLNFEINSAPGHFEKKLEADEMSKLNNQSSISFCYKSKGVDLKSYFCSKNYKVNKRGPYPVFEVIKLKTLPFISANNKKTAPKGTITLGKEKTVLEAFSQYGIHFFLEFSETNLDLDDIVYDNGQVVLTGHNLMPIGPGLEGNSSQWHTHFPLKNPTNLYFQNPLGLSFKQPFVFNKTLPTELTRMKLLKRVGLNFSLPKNGVLVRPQVFNYELDSDGRLKTGNFTLAPDSLEMQVSNDSIVFTWPHQLFKGGPLEVLDDGDALFQLQVDENEIFGEQAKPGADSINFATRPVKYRYTLNDSQIRAMTKSQALTFCLHNPEDGPKYFFCSRTYHLTSVAGQLKAEPLTSKKLPLISVANRKSPTKGALALDTKTKTPFEALTQNGAHYYFELTQAPSDLTDIVEDSGKVFLRGTGSIPNSIDVEGGEESWRLGLNSKKPEVFYWSNGGFVFEQDLVITQRLPTEKQRLYFAKNARSSTYIDHVPLQVRAPRIRQDGTTKITVASSEYAVVDGTKTVDWDFKASEFDKKNRSNLTLTDSTGKYGMYYDVYRGHPYEAIARLGPMQAVTSNVFLMQSQIGGSAWLEQFDNWDHPSLALQHWGITADYIHFLGVGGYDPMTNVTIFDSTLHYRFSPGIRDRDPSFGAMLSFESVKQNAATGNILGVGGFWFTPLPKFLDKLVNKIDILKTRKWLEFRAIYYPLSFDSTTIMYLNYMVNADIKFFFTEKYYGVVGIEYRNYYFLANTVHFIDSSTGQDFPTGDPVQAGISAATVGVGLTF